MGIINLRDHYPQQYPQDCFIEVSDEIGAAMLEAKRYDNSSKRRVFRNRAHYSLDRGDGIEDRALDKPRPPWVEYEDQQTAQELSNALAQLPGKQRRRLYAHFILGMSMAEIARDEGVHRSRVTRSIKKGLARLFDTVRCPYEGEQHFDF